MRKPMPKTPAPQNEQLGLFDWQAPLAIADPDAPRGALNGAERRESDAIGVLPCDNAFDAPNGVSAPIGDALGINISTAHRWLAMRPRQLPLE